jgi:Family of unknown function (DUF6152)
MTTNRLLGSVLGVLLLGVSAPGMAHHGQAGLFDVSRTIEVRGAVKEWSFVNPHPVLTLEVTDAAGARAEWEVYFGPSAVSHLRQRGFSAGTFKVGETIVVTGHPATSASAHGVDVWGAGTSVARADGSAIP